MYTIDGGDMCSGVEGADVVRSTNGRRMELLAQMRQSILSV